MSNIPPTPTANIGQELQNVPFGELVGSVGVALAEAQYRMDLVGMRIAQMMSGSYEELDAEGAVTTHDTRVTFGPEQKDATGATIAGSNRFSLLELGFTPTFYQFVDTVVEVKVSITINLTDERETVEKSGSFEGKAKIFKGELDIKTSSVSASYAAKYDYRAEASSMVRTKIVPLPPPAVLEERIRQYIADRGDIDDLTDL